MIRENMVDKGCASVDFWTPERILVPVRLYFRRLGSEFGIELDPATAPSNPTGAVHFFTPETDGLSRSWAIAPGGRTHVFVNPPYGAALYLWVPKIAREAEAGHNIVALLPGQRFDQAYWQEHLFTPRLTAICFVVGRIPFITPRGDVVTGNPYGSMLYVYNGRWDAAVEAFAPLGLCVAPRALEPWRPSPRERARADRYFAQGVARARQGVLFGVPGQIAKPVPAGGAPAESPA